ncbi:hypothetical protein [Nocardia sp. bgisy118]|uniref:hypothetical protein n=1 Tax=Nocardia sp. bgisy118 TaxID=3413786 RepID=UPI003F49F967
MAVEPWTTRQLAHRQLRADAERLLIGTSTDPEFGVQQTQQTQGDAFLERRTDLGRALAYAQIGQDVKPAIRAEVDNASCETVQLPIM